MDVLLSAHSRASSQSRQRTDPLIFTAAGCFDSKPNDRIDTSISYEDLWSSLTMDPQLPQLLLHLQHFDINFSSLKIKQLFFLTTQPLFLFLAKMKFSIATEANSFTGPLNPGHLPLMRVYLTFVNTVPISSAAVLCAREYPLPPTVKILADNKHCLRVNGGVQTRVYANNSAPDSKCHRALCR